MNECSCHAPFCYHLHTPDLTLGHHRFCSKDTAFPGGASHHAPFISNVNAVHPPPKNPAWFFDDFFFVLFQIKSPLPNPPNGFGGLPPPPTPPPGPPRGKLGPRGSYRAPGGALFDGSVVLRWDLEGRRLESLDEVVDGK